MFVASTNPGIEMCRVILAPQDGRVCQQMRSVNRRERRISGRTRSQRSNQAFARRRRDRSGEWRWFRKTCRMLGIRARHFGAPMLSTKSTESCNSEEWLPFVCSYRTFLTYSEIEHLSEFDDFTRISTVIGTAGI